MRITDLGWREVYKTPRDPDGVVPLEGKWGPSESIYVRFMLDPKKTKRRGARVFDWSNHASKD
jgi:hypothetical protein